MVVKCGETRALLKLAKNELDGRMKPSSSKMFNLIKHDKT